MSHRILQGDCIEQMAEMEEASVDAVVCDPPAGIGFMSKHWDHDKGGRDAWVAWLAEVMAEALRVCKPGAHAFVWALPRTSHWTAYALEEGGWEIRDRIAHHFGSGFPKSKNLGDGFGTALKPATEDWWLARKPFKGSATENFAEHGTGGINVDGCRIDGTPESPGTTPATANGNEQTLGAMTRAAYDAPSGRWPANIVLDEEAAVELDAQTGKLSSGLIRAGSQREGVGYHGGLGNVVANDSYGDSGGASRFFLTVPADKLCDLCGLPCAESAAIHSSQSEALNASAPEHVAGKPRPASEGSKSASGSPVSSAGPSSRTIESTATESTSTAPCDAAGSPSERLVRLASSAVSLCSVCETSIAQSVALWLTDPTQASEVGAVSGSERRLQILSRSLALIAAGWQQTGITPTTAELRTSFGYASHATANDTAESIGTPSRFAYHAKTSRGERNAGLEGFEERMPDNAVDRASQREGQEGASGRGSQSKPRANHHPTVKPINLMRWLVRLVTPPGGLILDPFLGSGSTGCAAVLEGFDFIGIEREAEYIAIAEARIAFWAQHVGEEIEDVLAAYAESRRQDQLHKALGQMGIFD